MTVFAVMGAYSINQSLFDVICLICFGILGYGMRRFGYSAGAMIIGFILGPLLERAFDQSMTISDGSFLIFVERPIALGLLILTVLSVASVIHVRLRNARFAKMAQG